MNYKEMENSLNYGEEYNFFYHGKEFWISKNSNGNYLTEVNTGYTQEFKSSVELLKISKIDNKSILDIWNEIKDQF